MKHKNTNKVFLAILTIGFIAGMVLPGEALLSESTIHVQAVSATPSHSTSSLSTSSTSSASSSTATTLSSTSNSGDINPANAAAGLPAMTKSDAYASYLASNGNLSSETNSLELPSVVDTVIDSDNLVPESTPISLETMESKPGIAVLSESSQQDARYSFSVENTGWYTVSMDYIPLSVKGNEILIKLSLDDAIPFEEASAITLSRIYKNENNSFEKDETGNELRPRQIAVSTFITRELADTNGYYNDPYRFYLTKGTHVIGVRCIQEKIGLDKIHITSLRQNPSYKDFSANYKETNYRETNGRNNTIEGETAAFKSDAVLYPTYNKANAYMQPADPSFIRLNAIGGGNFKRQGQWILWNIDVEESGLYNIGYRVRQNINRGMVSTRRIYIDSKILFKEMENVRFPYNTNWYTGKLGGNDPYQFYFEKGTHTIQVEVTPGDSAGTLTEIMNVLYNLNDLYRTIIMITGITPDSFRDYKLETEIPDLNDKLKAINGTLNKEIARIADYTGVEGSEAAFLGQITRQIDSFILRPSEIPLRLDAFKSNISSLGAWLLNIKDQPLEIDYLSLMSPDVSVKKANGSFWEQSLFDIKGFVNSFFIQYNTLSKEGDTGKQVNVWVNSGRDQAQIIKAMIDDDFTNKNKIKINLNLVNTGETLIQATLAGKGPDVALLVPKDLPVNLAARGALCDLSQFQGFDEIKNRFYDSAWIPYRFKDGYYAVPSTQNYNMMFYRTDIFKELGISPPDTWDDFYNIIPVIQRNNLQIGIAESQMIFETLVMQQGDTFYKNDLSGVNFDSPNVLAAFKMWTNFYTKYSFPLTFDFYNRFRTGEMPIGIAPYTTYNMFSVAAPELKGLWEMIPVPATKDANGKLNRTESATVLGSIMMSGAKDKDSAFQFISWWSKDDSQSRYGTELEQIMGPAARYDAANKAVLDKLPWKAGDILNLRKQWNEVSDVPQLPSSYYTSRNVTNAFRDVVLSYKNEREVLNRFAKIIDDEIARKNNELNVK